MRDLHDQIRIIRSISPVAVGTTGTGQTGKIVDRLRSGVYYNASSSKSATAPSPRRMRRSLSSSRKATSPAQ
jgi:hypothetical protein